MRFVLVRYRRFIFFWLALSGFWVPDLEAQDNHYWNNQYGSRAELVGGLVVGGILDLSATYYNPGSLGFVDEPSLILTNDAWEYVGYDFQNILPDGVDLTPSRFRPAPSMFAIQVPLRESKHRVALSSLSRYSFEIKGDGRLYPTAEQIDTAGVGASALEATADYKLSESWLGASWAYPLGPNIGVGVTMYGALRSHRARTQVLRQTVDLPESTTSFNSINEVSYWHARLLWKVGISVDLDPLGLGLNVTTPSVGLLGDGEVILNEGLTAAGSDVGILGELAATDQSQIPSTYSSGAAVAGGVTYRIASTKIFFSTEWFDEVDSYPLLDADEFIGQTSGDTLSVDVSYGLKSVVNWGVGLEQAFGERYHVYGAFFVDNSASQDESLSRLSAVTWDIRHLSAGGAIGFGKFDLTLGLSYGYGSDTIEREPILPGGNQTAQAEYNSLKAIFGLVLAI